VRFRRRYSPQTKRASVAEERMIEMAQKTASAEDTITGMAQKIESIEERARNSEEKLGEITQKMEDTTSRYTSSSSLHNTEGTGRAEQAPPPIVASTIIRLSYSIWTISSVPTAICSRALATFPLICSTAVTSPGISVDLRHVTQAAVDKTNAGEVRGRIQEGLQAHEPTKNIKIRGLTRDPRNELIR
jgi:hypothetical protein